MIVYTATVTLGGSTYSTTKQVTKVDVKLPEQEDDKGMETRLVVQEGITEVPATLIESKPELDTKEKIEKAMAEELPPEYKKEDTEGDKEKENTITTDVELQISEDEGTTWKPVEPESFPTAGLTITIPYPEGTNQDGFDFFVTHMFTHEVNGHKPGEIEAPNVTKTEKGLRFTVHGLSPIMVAWIETSDAPTPSDPEQEGSLVFTSSSQEENFKNCTTGDKDYTLDLAAEGSEEELSNWMITSSDTDVVDVLESGKLRCMSVGDATITATAVGRSSGKKYRISFEVCVKEPGRPTFTPSRISKKAKTFTVTSSTVRGADGFQVRYSLKNLKKSTKGMKEVSFKTGKKMIRKTVNTYKSGRKYYIQVRAYQKVNGKKIYSAWSPMKSIVSR